MIELVPECLGIQLRRVKIQFHLLEGVLAILIFELAFSESLLERGGSHAAQHFVLIE
jgi:hypothetical protein